MEHDRRCWRSQLIFWGLIVVIVLWNIPFLSKGIDVDDTAYSLARYRYIFDDLYRVESGKMLLTTIIGGILYRIGGSYRVLILNATHLFSLLLSGCFLYHVLKRKVRDSILLVAILTGMLYSCSWVRILNYNSLSMFFLTCAIAFLIQDLKEEKWYYGVFAGFILGINIYIRLPNILYACLGIVFLWNYGILKRNWKKAFHNLAFYAAGGVCGTILGAIIEIGFLGIDKFLGMFISTAASASQSGSRHGISHMLELFLGGIKSGIKVWIPWCVFLLIAIVCWRFLQKSGNKKMIAAGTVSIEIFVFAGSLYMGNKYDVLEISVMARFGGIIGVCFLGVSIGALFYYAKKNTFFSSIAVLLFLSETVLIFGTDNGWYYQVVFMIFPIMAVCVLLSGSGNSAGRSGVLFLIFVLGLMGSRGVRYATQYTFREDSISELTCSVELPGYAGMKTSEYRARILNELNEQLKIYATADKEILALGNASICYAIADAGPCINSFWPDLEGVTLERFTEQVERKLSEGNYPVIVLVELGYNQPYDLAKLEYVQKMIKDENYILKYFNENVSIYVPR